MTMDHIDPEMAQPVALIRVTGGRRPAQLILAVWADGFVVWSVDPVQGGTPYLAGWQEPANIAAAVEQARRLVGETTTEHYYGPDSRWTSLEIYQDGQIVVELGSWHELFEARDDLVATAGGVEPLAGRERAAVLAAQPANYRDFRRRWAQIKGHLLALIPAEGEAYEPRQGRPRPGL